MFCSIWCSGDKTAVRALRVTFRLIATVAVAVKLKRSLRWQQFYLKLCGLVKHTYSCAPARLDDGPEGEVGLVLVGLARACVWPASRIRVLVLRKRK